MSYLLITLLVFFNHNLFAGDVVLEEQLKTIPVSQYSCFFRGERLVHYYYTSQEMPEIGPPDSDTYCHNIAKLELNTHAFRLWDKFDPRFSDSDQSGKIDINEIFEEKLLKEYGIRAEVDYFVSLNWANAPVGEIPTLGKMMRVFVNPQTGMGKCPTQVDYEGEDPGFKILGQLIGFDTEALYIAIGENRDLPKDDVLLIRQSVLEQIWWYEEDGQRHVPDQVTAGQKMIQFYYPPNSSDPFNKKPWQELYTISDRRVLSGDNEGGFPTYDKRFGCIPK